MMRTKPAMMKKERTSVWWNISSCPIPPGYDAREVGSRIESALKKEGYSAPLTITAIGEISQTPGDKVLRDLSDTGMTLIHAEGIGADLSKWVRRNPPPANIMIIAGPLQMECLAPKLYCLDWDGYGILLAYPRQEDQVPEWINKGYLSVVSRQWVWKTLLDSGSAYQTRMLPSMGQPIWSCSQCFDRSPPTFEEFTTHIKHQNMDELALMDEDELRSMDPTTDTKIQKSRGSKRKTDEEDKDPKD